MKTPVSAPVSFHHNFEKSYKSGGGALQSGRGRVETGNTQLPFVSQFHFNHTEIKTLINARPYALCFENI